ncbi:uncharacterized protein LOC115629614 [Scaptodrosophila lebanonensis]|uniref:Uncharacterized protein LOC115629614 n=1 Tax=Drosophila lebanonensis TaxID=7225 RepID=A0A6J2U4B3_DROLE|nr:uncharacterized protein LOC115629614 [Scaptodrosophila lebanonensis]
MEALRRFKTRSHIVSALPSNQREDFYLRLVDLYGQYECLWNSNCLEFQNVAVKRRAWESIARALGGRVTAEFVKNRINGMRYRLNVYKLQEIEYEMSAGQSKRPEKLFYMDRFAFLDKVSAVANEEALLKESKSSGSLLDSIKAKSETSTTSSSKSEVSKPPSIASIVKQRLLQDQRLRNLTATRERLESDIASANRPQSTLFTPPPSSPQLIAYPGESISRTQMSTRSKKPMAIFERSRPRLDHRAKPQPPAVVIPMVPPQDSVALLPSDEEELYRMHWKVRQQLRTRRSTRMRSGLEIMPPTARFRELEQIPTLRLSNSDMSK